MKKSLVILLFVFIVSTFLSAEEGKFSIKPWAGYTTVAMDDVNSVLSEKMTTNKYFANYSDEVYSQTSLDTFDADMIKTNSTTKIDNASIFGIDIEKGMTPEIGAGVRISYLKTNDGTRHNLLQFPFYNSDGTRQAASNLYENNFKISNLILIPVLVGGSYTKSINEKWALNGNFYLGYGFASARISNRTTVRKTNSAGALEAATTTSYDQDFSGNAFVADIALGGEYNFSKVISIGANLGYRLAKVDKMKTSSGSTLVKDDGSSVIFDFSGMTATLALNYKI